MKHLLSKEHYGEKIHTALMKSSAPFYRQSPLWITPYTFAQENIDPLLYDFSKISTPPINKGVITLSIT